MRHFCLFPFLLALLLTACATKPPVNGALEGHIAIGPLTPVVREGQAEPTPAPEVYAAWPIIITSLDGKTEIARAIADAEGNYSVQLPAGKYIVDTTHPGIGGASGLPQPVEIRKDEITTLNIDIDTGIR